MPKQSFTFRCYQALMQSLEDWTKSDPDKLELCLKFDVESACLNGILSAVQASHITIRAQRYRDGEPIILLYDNPRVESLSLVTDCNCRYNRDIDFGLGQHPELKFLKCDFASSKSVENVLSSLATNSCKLETLILTNVECGNVWCIPNGCRLANLTLKTKKPAIICLPPNFSPEILTLHGVTITSDGITAGLFRKLAYVDISHNHGLMSRADFSQICQLVGESGQIRHLRLDFVTPILTAVMMQDVCNMLIQNRSLEFLSLVNNTGPDGAAVGQICEALRHNQLLCHLTLGIRSARGARDVIIAVPETDIIALSQNYTLQSFRFVPLYTRDWFSDSLTAAKPKACDKIERIMQRNRERHTRLHENLRLKAAKTFCKHYRTWPQDLVPDEVSALLTSHMKN